MTPLHLSILLHYHTIDAPYSYRDPLHANSDVVSKYTRDLVMLSYIESKKKTTVPRSSNAPPESPYHTTDKGKFFIDYICNLPEPVEIKKWEMPK